MLDLIRERVFKIGCSLRLKVRAGCKTAGLFSFFLRAEDLFELARLVSFHSKF